MSTGDGGTADAPIGVISAVITDPSRPGRLLFGVRRPSSLATRHPNVLSTPTLRLPPACFDALVAGDVPLTEPGTRSVDGPEVPVGRGGHVATIDAFALESLFARKLGMAEAIVAGEFYAVARRRFLSLDHVHDPLGTGRGEWTAMLTYEVHLREGSAAVPRETGSYSRLVWVDTSKVPQAVAHRDALLLDETLNAVEVCVQGLCVRVAARVFTC